MHLTLHLTTACNMRCAYCYSPPRDGEPMSRDIGRKALEFGAKMTQGSCGIIFFGGEPLLCKDLICDLIEYGRYRERYQAGRFHFKVTTNGLLLDDEFLQFAVKNNLLIAMSVDGVEAAHDAHRRAIGDQSTFSHIKERLQRLIEIKPYSNVLTVVNPDTARYLCESIEMLVGMNCRYLIVSPNYAADWRDEHFRILEREFKKLAKRYIQWTREGCKFYLSPFEVKISSHINQHCYFKERCELAQKQLSVDPQGNLFPCVQFTRAGAESEWCIGSIYEGIREERREALYRLSDAEKESCRDCAVKDRCNHTCGCLNWQTTGGINTVSPVLCRYERMLLPIADGIAEKLYRERNPYFLHKHYNAAYPVLSLIEENLERP